MPNTSGINGHPDQSHVSPEDIKRVLTRLAFENGGRGASVPDQLATLGAELGLNIGRSKLFKLRKELEIPSVRRNPHSEQQQEQAIIETLEANPTGTWGADQTRARVALVKGVLVKRSTVRAHNAENHPEMVERRMASAQSKKLPRKPLDLDGYFHQIHFDGHEKLNSQALDLGDNVGIFIYGGRCAWSGQIVILRVVPNARCVNTIGHLYLDWIETNGYVVPLTTWTDKGNEVGEMLYIQNRLRQLGDASIQDYPPYQQVRSVHNTTIEALWRWLQDADGRALKQELIAGRGVYRSDVSFHKYLYFWIWVPLVQKTLDDWRAYWNSHKVCRQDLKNAPTGVSPNMLAANPSHHDWNARDCSVGVEAEWVEQERERLGGLEKRNELFSWWPDDFGNAATSAWQALGSPTPTPQNAWWLFSTMSELLSASG